MAFQCKKNLSQEEILMELTKDDLGECNSCPNLTYQNGLLTCSICENKEEK